MATESVKSQITRRFRSQFEALPVAVQRLAVNNYRLWRRAPDHPSLAFHRLRGSSDRFSVRIGSHHRAIGFAAGQSITWVWIGSHAEYDRLVKPDK